MKFTLLIDNNYHPEKALLSEHGISIYFETDGYKWLFDTGNSSQFIDNANALGIDLSDVDFVLLSHVHKDHTGGLAAFLAINTKARVLLSAHIPGHRYFSLRHGDRRNITMDVSVLEKHSDRIQWIDKSAYISDHVTVIANIHNDFPTPKANSKLFIEKNGELVPDAFKHEIAIAVGTEGGLIVFSGCAHNGLLNTIRSSVEFTGIPQVKACIGGTHLPDKSDKMSYESEEDILAIARQVKDLYPEMTLFTGHCTGSNAQRILKSVLGDKMDVFYSGYTSEIK
ncbi:MBL fold metallo-hydrolase [Geofilum rubicundum]|uniref:Metal dependent hydrolase n=1 Tax=Geofilum rubicundum JCM 15548 TaxID=1236989 RepID=A0A0E9M2K4_9BACT|nr:MBL fold metallo-hydrolase [Geofilum rubicundum]GAO31749.1 metal dependent hydrolase [Geofilum rubicundum JCM 15548]